MIYEIFKSIHHQRVIKKYDDNEEIFDLYQCGIFNNSSTNENIELVELQPQSIYRPHFHENSSAVIYIIIGCGIFQLASKAIEYKPGLRIEIPENNIHGFNTKTRTLFLSIQSPPIINPINGEIDLHYERSI